MAPMFVDPAKTHEFKTAAAFERWLRKNHDTADEVWIRTFKMGSGIPSITWLEAIDVVLCWGWIDGTRKSFDEVSFVQRYSPRGKRSIWSKINQDNVARLTEAGRMQPSGQAEVDRAKADGRWANAYGSGAKLETPRELLDAINAEPTAQKMYDALSSQNRFALAFRIHNMKTEAGRKKKIAAFVEMLKRGETIYPQKAKVAK
jgi:uncharacterized protein YdeI (YjbR/CyaY-like superfamily)